MTTILLRIGKRGTSWESTDPDEVIELEFRGRGGELELDPSTYELDLPDEPARDPVPAAVLRAHAEHAASCLLSPKTGADVNVLGLGAESERILGEGRFAFTNDAHRVLALRDRGHLREVVSALLQNIATRKFSISKRAIISYAAGRLDGSDPEWERALGADRVEWMEDIARFRKSGKPA
jgi:hypothetical protein